MAVHTLVARPSGVPSRPSVLVAGVSAAEDVHPEYFEQDVAVFTPDRFRVTRALGVRDSSRARILEELSRHEIVHLSCHGFFDPRDALGSGLLLSDGARKPPRNTWSIPLLERGKFLLTAHDTLRTRLNVSLVTLNACSSGLQGERNAGDELEGFSRAFLLAGASTVLLSLWNVDQKSSLDFLERFYGYWLDPVHPLPKWRALHAAQLDLLGAPEEYLRHPYHWAPFALTGDWM